MGKPSTVTARAATVLGTLVILAGVGEVGLRIAGYYPLEDFHGQDWRGALVRATEDPIGAYELVPGARGFGWDCEIEINSHGFRGGEVALEAAEGVLRIAAIGDSVTFGNKLPVEHAYPAQLESALNDNGYPAEVLNLGVGGYDVLQSLLCLERIGLALEPDVVVLGYCVNDIGTVSLSRRYVEKTQEYASALYRLRIAQWLRIRSDTADIGIDLVRRNEPERFRGENEGYITDLDDDPTTLAYLRDIEKLLGQFEIPAGHTYLPWYASRPHVGKLRASLERFARLATDHGFRPLLVILPVLGEAGLNVLYDRAYALVEMEARRAGLEVVTLRTTVRANRPSTLRVDRSDFVHYNEKGNAIVARRIGGWLVEQGLFER
ncbi:MAG: GDSL-type esterase/lipase family protein [Planctomycetota bacterium]|nr:GDSL-type esterase/lipase family protein [Planctomycetota bacterium]MDP6761850.1 GDSL-type esterase/lipase family protein [Planctomycetota bacterium]MDP6988896.1 GDSL-type esterase/lipase family protein [Planctomycetota bacterium]